MECDGFYEDGRRYLAGLRSRGGEDYGFEDEFYFTLPAVSQASLR